MLEVERATARLEIWLEPGRAEPARLARARKFWKRILLGSLGLGNFWMRFWLGSLELGNLYRLGSARFLAKKRAKFKPKFGSFWLVFGSL